MKWTSSKDLMLLFVLSIITAIFTSTKPIDNFTVDILVFMIIFISSGYSLMSVLYPEESHSGLLRKPILFMESCVFLTVLVSVILKYSSLGLQLRDLILILSLITIIMSIAANILRVNYSKPELEESYDETLDETLDKSSPAHSKRELSKNLIIFTLLSLLMIITVIVPPLNKTPLWIVPGSLFICFIPGYLLIAVTFPRNDDLELIERFALAGGSSLILTSLIGLAFNYTPWSIRLELILIVLAVLSIIFCLITFIRMKKLPMERRLHIPQLKRILRILLIICIILTVFTVTYPILKPGKLQSGVEKTNSTDFYIKGMDVHNSNYTLDLNSGTETNLTLVLVNQEGSTVNYGLLIQVNSTILKQENITLKNNEKMEIPFKFTAGTPGQRKIEFLLYKLPDETPYRTQDLQIKVTERPL